MALASIQEREWLRAKETLEVLAGQRGNGTKAALTADKVGSIEEFIAGLRKKASSLDTDLSEINDQVGLVRQGLEETSNSLEQMGQNINGLSGDISSAQQRLDALNGQLDQFQQDIQGIRGDAQAAQQAVSQLKQSVAAVVLTAPAQGSITATPTASDFNGLVNDMQAMYQNMQNIKAAFS